MGNIKNSVIHPAEGGGINNGYLDNTMDPFLRRAGRDVRQFAERILSNDFTRLPVTGIGPALFIAGKNLDESARKGRGKINPFLRFSRMLNEGHRRYRQKVKPNFQDRFLKKLYDIRKGVMKNPGYRKLNVMALRMTNKALNFKIRNVNVAGKLCKLGGVASLALTGYQAFKVGNESAKRTGMASAGVASGATYFGCVAGAGWAGAVYGAKIGAVVGTAFGPIGTLIGGAAGAVIGGCVGAFLGEKLHRRIQPSLERAMVNYANS